jgi:hypothetical protein
MGISRNLTLEQSNKVDNITVTSPINLDTVATDLSNKADLVAGKVPASQLPSYVEDVLEFANLAALPVTGETGKIYVTLDTNKIFRWTGSTYIEISADAGAPVTSVNTQIGAVVLDTDDVLEGATNKYYTEARVDANTNVAANTAARHSAATLNAGTTTQQAANLVGQEIELVEATPTTAGVMSGTDKSKLDGVTAGANNYTHPNHTGEVTSTGDGVQVLDPTAISNKPLITPASGMEVLVNDGGVLKKVDVSSLGGGETTVVEGGLVINGIITPPTLTADTNNYSPTDLEISAFIRQDTDADHDLTGLDTSNLANGQIVHIVNISTANKIKLVNNSSLSLAANRFLLKGDLTIEKNESVALWFDSISNRLRVYSANI